MTALRFIAKERRRKMRDLNEVLKSLPANQRARVETKANRLIKSETLRQLRSIAKKTQQDVAVASGMSQYNISRLETRKDMLLSTLKAYVSGLGGRLRLMAEIPGTNAVELNVFGQSSRHKSPRRVKRKYLRDVRQKSVQ
jgi:transcriptional regulator with XRE-family HTH domain